MNIHVNKNSSTIQYTIPKRKSVSAIVPVFNEEKTATGLVKSLINCDLTDEVICINDGSTDNSLAELEKFGDKIRLINHKINRGKGFALADGISAASGEIVVFFDADLVNLSNEHIQSLLNPILNNETRAVLGYIKSDKFTPNIFSRLTGQRAYYRVDLLPHVQKLKKVRFGAEAYLNEQFSGKKVKKVPLLKLKGLFKYEKLSPPTAFKKYTKEAIEVMQEIGKREGFLPEEFQIIDSFSKVNNIKVFIKRTNSLTNEKMKQFFQDYVLEYLRISRSWLESLITHFK